MAIDKDKVFELFGRYWEIAHNEGRTGEGFPDLANDVLAELRDELDADDGEVFTGVFVEIDGHTYGLRPGAAQVVREALRDAGRYRYVAEPGNAILYAKRKDAWGLYAHAAAGHVRYHSKLELDAAIDAAMAKDGAP